MSQIVSVFLLEDHLLVRQGIRSALEALGEAKVVGEAGSAEEGLELLRTTVCDLVIMDLNLPGQSGTLCTERIRELYPSLPVLILSLHTQRSVVLDALRAGARGFVAKGSSVEELRAAVKTLAAGGSYFDAFSAPSVLALIRGELSNEMGLSLREDQILRLVCQGKSNQDIAEAMSLSLSSIKIHLRELFSRFEVSDRRALVSVCQGRFRQEARPLTQC